MFREMRRKSQMISTEETVQILNASVAGVLGVVGDDGYPYTVPVNYAYKEGKIFFHCANEGHKIDSIRKNGKVTFCVIDKAELKPEEFTTYYRSVSIFGNARILNEETEKREALEAIIKKYSPDFMDIGLQKINKGCKACIVEIKIDHMTGKVSAKH